MRGAATDRAGLLASASAGDAEAQFKLGLSYDLAKPRDARRAVNWYMAAAERGNTEAQTLVGESLRDGVGVRPNARDAVKWFRLAAAAGDADAQLSLGFCLWYGQGVRRDRAAALRWYRASAEQGNDRAAYNLGQAYRKGYGVGKSLTRALQWYEKAATTGHVDALHWLARIHGGSEVGFPGDPAAELLWLRRAARAGDAESITNLGVRYHEGHGARKNFKLAADLYRRGARGGDTWAQYLLGLCYRDGEGVRRDRRVARVWFRRAATRHPEARLDLRRLALSRATRRRTRGRT